MTAAAVAETAAITVIRDRCTACGACVVTCPTHALRPAPGAPLLLAQRCDGCWACIEVCPRDALQPSPDPEPVP